MTVHFAVSNLLAAYCHGTDDIDHDLLDSCFALKATFEVVDRMGNPPAQVRVGRVAIVDSMLRVAATRVGFRHHTLNPWIQVSEDEQICRVRSDFRVLDGRSQPESHGRYEDELVLEDGSWCFVRRRVRYDWRVSW